MNPIEPFIYDSLIDEVQSYLAFVKAMGCEGVPLSEDAGKIVESWKSTQAELKIGSETGVRTESEPAEETLDGIHRAISSCRRCRLADERKVAVFGAGPEHAKLMIIGGFPEAADEESGLPYSGEAGALLTKIIEAIKFARESIYICHAVKCRPSEDRTPNRFEAKACRTYLDRQIKAVRPQIVCVFGELAAQLLLRTDAPIAKLRGRFHDYEGIRVMITHDPAHLIANPTAKRAVWEDMKKLMEEVQGSEFKVQS